jgi:integrase
MTLSVATGKYAAEHGQHLSSYWDVIDPHFREFNDFFGGDMYIDEIADSDISRFISKQNVKPGTVNRKLDTLSALMRRAGDRWGVEISPIRISKHKLVAPEARTTWITVEQANKLIDASAPHLKPCIRFALLTGLRLSNIIGLKWEQVDMKSRIIRSRVKSKKPGGKLLETAISDELLSLLIEQKPQKTGHVFVRRFKKRKPQPIKQFRNSFKSACKKAGLVDFRFHDLRHTAASWMVQNKVPLDVVQKVLGHSKITQTQKYAHREASAVAEALNTLSLTYIRHTEKNGKRKNG